MLRNFGTMMSLFVASAYDVEFVDVDVPGQACREHHGARVYYPSAPGRFPLVSWAHGYNNYGHFAYACYADMLTALVAQGYVVIASTSSNFPLECADEWKDQLRSLEWAQGSSVAERIDFSRTGLMGHSMGGGATYHGAGQAGAVEQYNISAAVALHPQITSPSKLFSINSPLVPVFYGTGSKDTTVDPNSVSAAYEQTWSVPKVFAEIEGAVHDEPMCDCDSWVSPGSQRFTPYVIAFFDCHVKGVATQCSKIYGSGSESLCFGSVGMTMCKTGNAPASIATVQV